MFALPMRYAFRVPAAIHLFSVLVERQVRSEAACTPMYPGRERSSSIAVMRVNTESSGTVRDYY